MVPPQRHELAYPQSVAVRDKEQSRVAMAVTACSRGGADQLRPESRTREFARIDLELSWAAGSSIDATLTRAPSRHRPPKPAIDES